MVATILHLGIFVKCRRRAGSNTSAAHDIHSDNGIWAHRVPTLGYANSWGMLAHFLSKRLQMLLRCIVEGIGWWFPDRNIGRSLLLLRFGDAITRFLPLERISASFMLVVWLFLIWCRLGRPNRRDSILGGIIFVDRFFTMFLWHGWLRTLLIAVRGEFIGTMRNVRVTLGYRSLRSWHVRILCPYGLTSVIRLSIWGNSQFFIAELLFFSLDISCSRCIYVHWAWLFWASCGVTYLEIFMVHWLTTCKCRCCLCVHLFDHGLSTKFILFLHLLKLERLAGASVP